MTHTDPTQAATTCHPTSATVVSDVAAQMQRIEQARQRIHASSHAITSGALMATPVSAHHAQTNPSALNDPSQQRVASMGRAMDQVLQGMQDQALADLSGIMQQHAALRQFQQNMAREQQPPASSVAHGTAIYPKNDDIVDVEAKTVSEP